jgi:hypothetical protein
MMLIQGMPAAVVLRPRLALHLQELEESRKLYTSQKRALKDALSAAAERDAAEAAAGESGLEAATAAAEEEVERLTQVCDLSRLCAEPYLTGSKRLAAAAAAWLFVAPQGGKQPARLPSFDPAMLVPLQEIAQLKTRSALELHAKELEVAELQQQLARHEADK